MKQEIMQAAKKLKRFTLDDLIIILEGNETDIKSCLQDLLEEKYLFKISANEYAYIKQNDKTININDETTNLTKLKDISKNELLKIEVPISLDENNNLIFKKEDEQKIFDNATITQKRSLIKYVTVLNLARNLQGKNLVIFLKKIGEENPKYKMGYSTFMHKRNQYAMYGLKGILPQYVATHKGSSVVPDELYNQFKKLYLTPKRYPLKKCVDILEQNSNEEMFPCFTSFKRRLLKEYSEELIQKLRSIPKIPIDVDINIPGEISEIKPTKNKQIQKYEFFLDGAIKYLNDIKDKKTNTEISYYGYVKNHLIPYFKKYKFIDITQEIINDFINFKISEGYTIASIARIIGPISVIIKKYSPYKRLYSYSCSNCCYTNEHGILSKNEIDNIVQRNGSELWMLLLGIKPFELLALNYEDIDYKNKTICINKVINNNKVKKYRLEHQIRNLRIPDLIFDNLTTQNGRIFNKIEYNNYEKILNTHIKLLLDHNIQINIISKDIGCKNVHIFEKRFNYLLPQEKPINLKII